MKRGTRIVLKVMILMVMGASCFAAGAVWKSQQVSVPPSAVVEQAPPPSPPPPKASPTKPEVTPQSPEVVSPPAPQEPHQENVVEPSAYLSPEWSLPDECVGNMLHEDISDEVPMELGSPCLNPGTDQVVDESGENEDNKPTILIELKNRRLVVCDADSQEIQEFGGLEWSRVGIGSEMGSHRTPVGEFTISKEPHHRYGPALRLDGYQGEVRGILIHEDNTRDGGSKGCIHLPSGSAMRKLFDIVEDGSALIIRE